MDDSLKLAKAMRLLNAWLVRSGKPSPHLIQQTQTLVGARDEEPIPTTNEIQMFFHCKHCIDEKPDDVSPRDWMRSEVGFTRNGLQIWCIRHECNVVHIDFEGMQHPAR